MSQNATANNAQTTTLSEQFGEFFDTYHRNDIGELAQRYPSDQRSLRISWMDLYSFSSDLADDYVTSPKLIREHAEQALSEYDLPIDVDLSRAHVRVTGVKQNEFDVGEYRSQHIGQLCSVYGQVERKSGVRPLVVETAFECQRCGTLNRIPNGGGKLQEPHECEGCERQGPFTINRDQSTFIDFQLIRLSQPPEQTADGQGDRINVHLRDDLVESVEAGDRLHVAAQYRIAQPDSESGSETDPSTFEPYLDAHSIEVEQTDFEDINTSEHEDEIKAIARGDRGDPYDLLVDSIAPKIQGHETVKLAIALQLFGGVRVGYPDGSFDRGDSHILLLGDPGTAKSTMLRAVENLSPRSVYASGKGSSAAGLTAAAVPDSFGDQKWSLQAGAMVLANKGIACVDEIDKMNEEAVSSMHDALESQSIDVHKAGINAKLPAQTALLAAGNPKYGRFDEVESIADQIDLAPALMSRFDLMFMLSDQPDEDRDSEIISNIIDARQFANTYSDPSSVAEPDADRSISLAIDADVLRAYIAYSKQTCRPKIRSDEVRHKLKDSFIRFRASNGYDANSPVPVTFRKLEGILRLAEASARVRLSETVEVIDIKRATKLIGQSLRDIGMDPENDQFDADIVETGSSTSQRQRYRSIKDLLREALSDGDYEGGVPIDEFVSVATDAGHTETKVRHSIDKLKERGEVYEPPQGGLKPV